MIEAFYKDLKTQFLLFACLLFVSSSIGQSFTRSELNTPLITPWEITYGPDGFLWLSEFGGKVSRVNPITGSKVVVYTASDYFNGSPLEALQTCGIYGIQAGTLGLTLHPEFLNPNTAYIYYLYAYNSGTVAAPSTKFKVVRLLWDATSGTISSPFDLIMNIPTAYDHIGGRLLALKRNGISHLFLSIGDHGISEDNSPTCYTPQSLNPNNYTQDPNFMNGKIHRFNMDGSVPLDNPIPNNSLYTRGHRNPQGLIYNSKKDLLYNVEHGDRTDDEINVLEAGKNYGWKNVRGYHNDNNYPGESAFIANYVPLATIPNDALKEPLFSWCNVSPPQNGIPYLDWCTVAPSDGNYYADTIIREWNNSLLVVTLKNGSVTDNQVYVFKLDTTGKQLVPSTLQNPNPTTFFSSDQALNGRLRDIAISPDGKKIFLINNGGIANDKITVYEYDNSVSVKKVMKDDLNIYIIPNPSTSNFTFNSWKNILEVKIFDLLCKEQSFNQSISGSVDVKDFKSGMYFIKVSFLNNITRTLIFVKE
jgi:aldose sugar dehydrogenase